MVVASAVDEDVDVIGLSMLSGAHLTLAPRVVQLLEQQGADIPVVVGGIIPDQDIPRLLSAGVAKVLRPGASAEEVAESVRQAAGASAA
jgi:methylmalonyl-CoA mutase C-terminal domain/subunit